LNIKGKQINNNFLKTQLIVLILIFKFIDIAVDTTSDIMNYDNIMNLPSNMKDKIISVFTHKPSVPNTEMVDGQVSKVKIIKTVTTDNGEVPTDSKTVITTEEIETEMSQP